MLKFIKSIVPEYQKLFPYRFFLSRESVIREEKCSICGKVIKLRSKCEHIPGKLYMGEMTFTPMSGAGKFDPLKWDKKFGEMLILPSKSPIPRKTN